MDRSARRGRVAPGSRALTNRIRRRLLAWFEREKRQLPWRATRDPYRVWVSEVMLQQTTVAAVRNRYGPFLARFPDLPALARAREDSVLAEWSGLGYYARARNLWRTARKVQAEEGGVLPRDPRALARLPGFGGYTAAAVACLAHGARIPAIEANVTRVLSRLFAIGGVAGTGRHRAAVHDRMRTLLEKGPPERLTAALMDLGQLLCTPRRPLCAACPLRDDCAARRLGPERYPERAARPRPVEVRLAAACARRNGRALLVRRRARPLAGLWEFPCAEGRTAESARRRLAERIRTLGLLLEGRSLGTARHTVVNRHISIEVFEASRNPRSGLRPSKSPDVRWFRPKDLETAAIPTLTRKVARAAKILA